MWHGGGGNWGYPGIGMFMMVFFWILIIVGVVFLIRWVVEQSKGAQPMPEGPMDILRKRYARGEISKEQFEEMKKDLQ